MTDAPRPTGTPTLAVPVTERDHCRGSADAPVTLVEYGDFECPYTRRAERTVRTLRERMGDRLRVVYRNFPLRGIHPHAERAAEAAEAAANQGKYWEMHDLLFDQQHWLDDEHLVEYARTLSLDADELARELDSGTHAERVEQDLHSGDESGVEGTPTFFINGVRYDGSYDEASLQAALEEAAGRPS